MTVYNSVREMMPEVLTFPPYVLDAVSSSSLVATATPDPASGAVLYRRADRSGGTPTTKGIGTSVSIQGRSACTISTDGYGWQANQDNGLEDFKGGHSVKKG